MGVPVYFPPRGDAVWGKAVQSTINAQQIILLDYLTRSWKENYDWIVQKNGAVYEGVNGLTKQVVYSDASGKTVLQSCIDAVRGTVDHSINGGANRKTANAMIFIKDEFNLDGDLDVCDVGYLTFVGKYTKFHIKTSEDVAIDQTNSSNILWDNFFFDIPAGYTPKVAFLLARDASGASAEFNYFYRCWFDNIVVGTVQTAMLYNYASELGLLEACVFRHTVGGLKLTAYNVDGITSAYKTIYSGGMSCRGFNSYNTTFLKANEAAVQAHSVTLESSGESIFMGNFFYAHQDFDNYAFFIDFTNDGIYTLNMLANKFEGKCLTTGPVVHGGKILGARIRDNYFSVAGMFPEGTPRVSFPYFNCNAAGVNFQASTIDNNYFDYTGGDYALNFNIVHSSTINLRQIIREPLVTIDGTITASEIIMHDPDNLDISAATLGEGVSITMLEGASPIAEVRPVTSILSYGAKELGVTGGTTYLKPALGHVGEYIGMSEYFRSKIPLSGAGNYVYSEARIIFKASGTILASTKGIKYTLGTVDVGHEWTGTDLELFYGPWVDISGCGATEPTFAPLLMSTDDTEDITVFRVELQLR